MRGTIATLSYECCAHCIHLDGNGDCSLEGQEIVDNMTVETAPQAGTDRVFDFLVCGCFKEAK